MLLTDLFHRLGALVEQPPTHLHGGNEGFDKKLWRSEAFMGTTGPGVKFTYTSPDMEEGYPGRLSASDFTHCTDLRVTVINIHTKEPIMNTPMVPLNDRNAKS